MFKRFALITAGLAVSFGIVSIPGHADASVKHRTSHRHVSRHRAPNADERAELRLAQRVSGSRYICKLEWDGPAYPGYEAICTKR
jgi:hypothetical protein